MGASTIRTPPRIPSAMLPSQWNAFSASGIRNTSRNRQPSTIDTTRAIAEALKAKAMYIAPRTAAHVRGSVTDGLVAMDPNAISASVMPIRNCETLYAIFQGDHRFIAWPIPTPRSTPTVRTLGGTRMRAPAHTPSVSAKLTVSVPRLSGIEQRSAVIVRMTINAVAPRSRAFHVVICGARITRHATPKTLAPRIRIFTRRGRLTDSPQLHMTELHEFELQEFELQHIPLQEFELQELLLHPSFSEINDDQLFDDQLSDDQLFDDHEFESHASPRTSISPSTGSAIPSPLRSALTCVVPRLRSNEPAPVA